MSPRQLRTRWIRWPWIMGTLAAVVLAVTAFQGDLVVSPGAFTAAVLSAIGLAILAFVGKGYQKGVRALEQFGDVLGALYGPRDPAGAHQGGGLVDQVSQTAEMVAHIPHLERKVDEAVTAALEARRLAAEALGARPITMRTRAEDMDHG